MTRFIVSLIFLLLLSLSGGPEAFMDAQKQTYHVPVANVRRLKIQNAFLNDYGATPNPRHDPPTTLGRKLKVEVPTTTLEFSSIAA